MKYIFSLLPLFFASLLVAQVNSIETPKSKADFKPMLDFRFQSGISLPLGKYKMLTSESDDRSSAGYGGYGDLMLSLMPLPTSRWRLSLTLGYMHHPFEEQRSKDEFALPVFEGSPWHSFYTMAGIGFVTRSRLSLGVDVSVGLLGYQGGNIVSGQITNDTMEVRSWSYDMKAAAAIKASLLLGYQASPKFSIFTTVTLFYAAGVRAGTMRSDYYLTDGQQVVGASLENSDRPAQNQTSVIALNLGLGFRYKFYDEPDQFNYKFNIEENK